MLFRKPKKWAEKLGIFLMLEDTPLCSNAQPPASRVCPLTTPPIRHLFQNEIVIQVILCSSDFEISIWDPK